MFESDDVLEAAVFIKPYLKVLVGDKSFEIGIQLDQLLEREQQGDKVDNLVLDLLGSQDATRQWMQGVLLPAVDGGKGFEGLAGNVGGVASKVYRCPESGCKVQWSPSRAGATIMMLCPLHARLLLP